MFTVALFVGIFVAEIYIIKKIGENREALLLIQSQRNDLLTRE